MTTYTYSTDAVKNVAVDAENVDAVVAVAVAGRDWAKLDSTREGRDIADGAWLTIFDADGVAVLRRGEMP